MYRDPQRLRQCPLKLWLTPEEDRLVDALADFTGSQKSVMARELMLERLRLVMNEVGRCAPGDEVTLRG